MIDAATCSAAPEVFVGVDMARIPPRFPAKNDAAIESIRADIYGLLRPRYGKKAPLTIADLYIPYQWIRISPIKECAENYMR